MLGTITPGESIKYIKGFCKILNPLTPFVVATEAVALAAPDLFYKSDIILIWLMILLLPTFGIPQIANHKPTFSYFL